ncbi:GIY-YIG nuclease family protein [Pantanalinema sp. GBBB05]|uniref:GIY-YIG nuclease family protein n=1 Tax=Pantanalinema sp. GBBB05 TaxID=2604139 RepID=UPI001E07614A|nr:GIY-YIG nuclease family protein [Pantanalinema sp. GBBB05]
MASGYVYILTNVSLPGMIKVGRTLRDSRSRARELFTTGLPTPFQVAFEIFSDEYEKLEADFHQELHDFRISTKREFFKYPLDKAIGLLQRLNSPPVSQESVFQAEDIFESLKQKYPGYLKPDIVAVRIVQPQSRVWLEITQEEELAGYLKNQTITRTDLGFISDDVCGNNLFCPEDDVRENARKFVEDFSPYSIKITTDLFHDSAWEEIKEIDEKFNLHK